MSSERHSFVSLVSQCGCVFTVERARAFATSTGIGQSYLSVLLRSWVDRGLLWRVKRGLYAVQSNVEGLAPPHPFAVGTALATPSAVSGLAALHFHGVVKTFPDTVDVSTPQRMPTPVSARGAFRIVSVAEQGFVGVEQHRVGDEAVWIFSLERALIDLFVTSRRFGGACEALALFEDALGRFDPERLSELAMLWGPQTSGRIRAALREFSAPSIEHRRTQR